MMGALPRSSREAELEAEVARLRARLRAVLREQVTPEDEDALALLAEAAPGPWFTSADAWEVVEARYVAAGVQGHPDPLWAALEAVRVRGSTSLGKWLSRMARRGAAKNVGSACGRTLWEL